MKASHRNRIARLMEAMDAHDRERGGGETDGERIARLETGRMTEDELDEHLAQMEAVLDSIEAKERARLGYLNDDGTRNTL